MKIKHKLISAIVLFIFLFFSHTLISQDFFKIGYLPTYRFNTIDQIDLNKLTHLNIAFANPDANGYLTTNGVDITPIVQQAHNAELDVFIALAGGGAPLSDWENWINATNRSFLINNIIEYTKQYNLQGIDVDLEWGTVNDDYSDFVLALRDSVDQHDLKLSVALPGTYRYPEITDEALASFDWINLMAYDLTGPWAPINPGPHSPYSFAQNSINYWVNQGVDKSKLTLGVPFYGYDFTDQNNVTALTYAEIISTEPANAQTDQVGQIYYNGLQTIEQKTTLALNELSGVMIWELGQDSFDEYSLLSKINNTIDEFLVSTTDESMYADYTIVYPNPFYDVVHIKLSSSQDFKSVLLSNCQKTLMTQNHHDQELISFNMNEFPKGMYYLLLEGSNFTKTVKLVKL